MERLPPFPISNPELLKEWDFEKNVDLDPHTITAGSTKKVWWKCVGKQHKWQATICNRARKGRGCPKCSKLDFFGDTHPHLLNELHPTKNNSIDIKEISSGSAKVLWWLCPNGHEWESSVTNRTHNNAGCATCKIENSNLEKNYPEIAKEWHPTKNAKLKPSQVTEKSARIVWWRCSRCLNEWPAKILNRTHLGANCPLCSREEGVLKTKVNQVEKIEAYEANYNYDSDNIDTFDDELNTILTKHLRVEQEANSIEAVTGSRMASRTNYQPYYQRNYVWDNKKATYFIESLLLGTEVPPLIYYETTVGYEIIDGRQRYETIKRFKAGEFSLSSQGLYTLTQLAGQSFDDLSIELKDQFLDTNLRIVKLAIVDPSRFTEAQEDRLKKEIFRRYNSGITPLRRFEVDKAIYLRDEPTAYLKKKFENNPNLYRAVASLFLSDRDKGKLEEASTLEKLLQVIRLLLVAAEMPVGSLKRKGTVDQVYERYVESTENVSSLYDKFLEKVRFLLSVRESFERKNITNSRYWYETLYWAISVLEKENISISSFVNDESVLEKLSRFYSENIETFLSDSEQFLQQQHTKRYTALSRLFGDIFQKDLQIYLTNRIEIEKSKNNEGPPDLTSDPTGYFGIKKQEAMPYSVESIVNILQRGRFQVRPPYQRGEVINRTKSSAIIESILLGIKLPPLFIYRRKDNVSEVIDGQQRLLSILGYMGEPFIDERNNKIFSNKNEYKLSGLRILKELNGKSYKDLSVVLKDKILDFSLSIIYIDEELNPLFDPVDLFVRLNSRPYPIKENTFEMWNSYVSNELIDSIKDVDRRHGKWFYLARNNVRMRNEELLTIISYLEYKLENEKIENIDNLDFMEVISRQGGVSVRLKEKAAVTRLLNRCTIDKEQRSAFLNAVKRLDKFITKIKTMLIDRDIQDVDEYLDGEITRLFNVSKRKGYTRRLQDFYGLWFIAHFLPPKRIAMDRKTLKAELFNIVRDMKTLSDNEIQHNVDSKFLDMVKEFRSKHTPGTRKLKISRSEVERLIQQQNNICPYCKGPLYIGDEVEQDHIKSLLSGGEDDISNIQILHSHCNRSKGYN